MYEDGALTSDYNFVFNYQDEKVINVVRGNTGIEFTYSGNKIISSSMFTNDVLTRTSNCSYTGDLLTSIIDNSQNEKPILLIQEMFCKKPQDRILMQVFGSETVKRLMLFPITMIQQRINTEYQGTFSDFYKSTYEYVNSNNPFKNMNPYLRLFANFETIDIISKNTVTKQYKYSSATSTTPILSHNYVTVYNSDNYPVSVKKYLVDGNQLISETTITYTE